MDELDRSVLALRDRLARDKRRLADQIADERQIRDEVARVTEELRATEDPERRGALTEQLSGLGTALRLHIARLEEARAALHRLGDELEDARQRRTRHIAIRKTRPN